MTNELSEVTEAMIEALLQAQCDAPGLHWSDGLSEGLRAVYQMKAEKGLAAALAARDRAALNTPRAAETSEGVERLRRIIRQNTERDAYAHGLLDSELAAILAALTPSPVRSPGGAENGMDEWRCVACEAVVKAPMEPRRCPDCRGWTFAHIQPAKEPLTPIPADNGDEVERLREALKPYEHHHGPLPDFDSPVAGVFDAGVEFAVELLAKELGVENWTPCEGTEEYESDLGGTLMNIVLASMPKDQHGDAMHPSEVRAALTPSPVRSPGGADNEDEAEAELLAVFKEAQEGWSHPLHRIALRAGFLLCREYMARFVEQGGDTATAQSIRANWIPQLGEDPKVLRKLDFAECVTADDMETGPWRAITPPLASEAACYALCVASDFGLALADEINEAERRAALTQEQSSTDRKGEG